MKKPLRENIYNKIRNNIIRGQLSPGERLIEDRLAKEFKVSRSPVREALRLLESEGLIKFEANRGITVSKLSIKQVEEIYELRWVLEGHAARISASKATAKDLKFLKDHQKQLKIAAKERDMDSWLKHNALFHGFFYKNCGNNRLTQFVDSLKQNVNRYYFVTITVPWHFQMYLDHHDAMLKGCEKQDGAMVEKYVKLHLESMKKDLIGTLKKRGVVF
jgi:DNA-binding GntR family transcriptional regulator